MPSVGILQSIHLVRYDSSRKIVYILAGVNDGLGIIINPDGGWRYDEA
jgi:hypothetical protein